MSLIKQFVFVEFCKLMHLPILQNSVLYSSMIMNKSIKRGNEIKMLLDNFKRKNTFENILLLFILVQPILDLATSLAINYLNSEFTAGILIRFAMMAIGAIYLLFVSNSKKKKTAIIYLLLLGLFISLGFINNIMVKSPMSLAEEIKFIIKSVYFVVLFFSYLYVFKQLQSRTSWENTTLKYIVYAMTLVGLSMLIAGLTNTAFSSYTYNKVGNTGWFYAGNEISAIMSICFPIVVLYAIKKTTSLKSFYYWIPALLLIYSLMAVGTKVGFGAALVTLLISLVMLIVELFMMRANRKYNVKANLLINAIIFILFIFYIPFSPIAANTSIHLSLLQEEAKTGNQAVEHGKPEKPGKTQGNKENLDNQQLENFVLSSRGEYLSQQKEYFTDAPISQKMLGMGYAGNYKEYPKLTEMDFYDLFFSFGIVGFILYFIPFFLLAILIIKKIFTNFKSNFTLENILIASGIVLGVGIAFTAGHVFTAPAVSIYLAILIASLYMKIVNPS
ncbi:O-antigen ligase family protein [Neobacillus sp. NPDC097160]|uniref:O-antigen ligase family protein n=1 Tax=Neobacillus sp. NPDC097160 TaxID=3364298 RepID=UPI00380E09F7